MRDASRLQWGESNLCERDPEIASSITPRIAAAEAADVNIGSRPRSLAVILRDIMLVVVQYEDETLESVLICNDT